MTRRSLAGTSALAHDALTNHRSLCQTVPADPCLKLARRWFETASPASCQTVEPESDIALPPKTTEPSPLLYRGAGYAGGFSPMPGRGGPRNRASRRSIAISEAAARNLIEATLYADWAGMPFNRFTTVHWHLAGVTDGLKATSRFLKLLADWLRSNGYPFAYIWVRETGDGKGEHVHILWHGPADFPAFRRLARRYLKACGAVSRKGVCHTVSVARSLHSALSGGTDYRMNLARVLEYHVKGADAAARASLGISRSAPGGELVGRRCSVSQNIGRAVRRRSKKWQG